MYYLCTRGCPTGSTKCHRGSQAVRGPYILFTPGLEDTPVNWLNQMFP